jgi:RNA polymerase sigma-70 factor (ECF subfamily)
MAIGMNEEQFHQCITAFSDGLYRFALKNLKDQDEAKEIVQGSFEKLWIHRKNVDPEKSKNYLFTVAYHLMADYWRRNKKMMPITDESAMQQAAPSSEYKGLKGLINKALETLPDIQRTVILLRDYEGYSYEEIGSITGLNESQVKVYIFRARQTLKNHLGSMEGII